MPALLGSAMGFEAAIWTKKSKMTLRCSRLKMNQRDEQQ
jgi:hypothetical protein